MASEVIRMCVDYAIGSPHVRGLILLGSFATNDQCSSSDVDLLFLLTSDVEVSVHQNSLCNLFMDHSKFVYRYLYLFSLTRAFQLRTKTLGEGPIHALVSCFAYFQMFHFLSVLFSAFCSKLPRYNSVNLIFRIEILLPREHQAGRPL